MPRRTITLKLGPVQARVVQDALSDYCIGVAEEVQRGDPAAIRDQNVAMNVRETIGRKLRRVGLHSSW